VTALDESGDAVPAEPAMFRSRSARTAPVQPAPPGLPARAVLRLPSFWVVLALLIAGGARMAQIGGTYAHEFPLATASAVLLFALYAVPFWFFIGQLDYLEREPPVLVAVAFAWGALVATAVSIPGGAALQNLIAKLGSPGLAAGWGVALAGPTVEEIAKTLGVVAIVLIARAQVNSVLDGVVYGALVGLGFQIVENIVYALSAVAMAGGGDRPGPVVTTFFLRGFLGGLWSHTLFGALAGAGIGYLVVRTDRPVPTRLSVAVLAVVGAWISHVLWNSPLLDDGLGNGALAVLVVLVVKGLPPLMMILLLIRAAHDREADYYVAQLAALGDPELVTAEELRVLGSGSRRAGARWHAQACVGRSGRVAVRRLQRAQARLAVALSREPNPVQAIAVEPAETGTAVRRLHHEVRRQRRHLVALGHPDAFSPAGGPGPWRRTASTVGSVALAVAVVWAAISALGGG
jgi:RsiW-degrading membrane proteinase PrsW (M82 family)